MGFFSDLFGQKKKRDLNLGNIRPYQSLTEIPTGAAVNTRILGALNQGKDIGFGEDFVKRSTSPFVASREARWEGTEKPEMRAAASSRGLGRSTLAQREEIRGVGARERDINEMMAQAYVTEEMQKKSDIKRYMDAGFSFAQAESIQRDKASQDEVMRRKFQIGKEAESDAAGIANARFLTGMGLSTLGPMVGGPVGAGMSMAGGGMGGGGGGVSAADRFQMAREQRNITSTIPFSRRVSNNAYTDFMRRG